MESAGALVLRGAGQHKPSTLQPAQSLAYGSERFCARMHALVQELTLRSNSSLMGQAGVVSSMRKETLDPASEPWMARSLMKPQATMSIPKSGSTIRESAASTSPSLDAGPACAGEACGEGHAVTGCWDKSKGRRDTGNLEAATEAHCGALALLSVHVRVQDVRQVHGSGMLKQGPHRELL